MSVVRSACPLDCPDACSLEVTVDQGRITKIDGGHIHPLTQGFICEKVRHFADHVYSAERIMQPGRRIGHKGEGRFESCSWNEALGLVASKFEEVRHIHGGEAILPFSYGGSNGYLSQDTTDARLFFRLGASRLARTVCAAPTGRAASGLYGKMPGVALHDYVHARLIVVWGANPSVSGIHLVPVIREARRRGATLVVIDPRRTSLAKEADLHLALRPGTDLVVALSIIRWFFEVGRADVTFLDAHATGTDELRRRASSWTFERAAEVSGIPAGDLVHCARLYADSRPAVIRCGWGPERNRNGGSAIAAILALPAVAGHFGVRGGGYTMSNSGAWTMDSLKAAGEAPPATRIINMNRLGETLLTASPPVHALFVYNANPVATLPNQEKVRQGLIRENLFTVVFDQVMTDTARYADVILPATTFLEHTELSRGYGAMVLQHAPPVIPPVGEARSNVEVFEELCRRMKVSRPKDVVTIDGLMRAVIDSGGRPEVRQALDREGAAFPESGLAPVQFVDVFPRTPDRKVHLVPEALDREAPVGLYGYQPDPATDQFPLALISPATKKTISSTMGQLHKGLVAVELHPQDAGVRGIVDGASVRVFNEYGEVRCPSRLNAELRQGVVLLPKGLWSHNTMSGTTANALAPDTLTDLGGGACFNDARVQIERVS